MNKQHYAYKPTGGVCSKEIIIETENNTIGKIEIVGGCHGNSQGVSKLLVGMNIDEAISRLEGIKCGRKNTSCPDQIAQALKMFQKDQ